MNKNYGIFGVAIQDAASSEAAAPTVTYHASGDSNGISAEKSNESVKLSIGGRSTAVSSYVKEIATKSEVTTLAFADLLGLLVYAANGADSVVAGTADNTYVHSIKAGASLPYITCFEQKGDKAAPIAKMIDAKVDALKLTAEGVAPIQVDYTLSGCMAKWTGETTWTGPAFDISDGYFNLADAEVLFSLSTGEPVAVPVGVILSKLELDIANNISAKYPLGSAVPGSQVESSADVTVSIEGTTDSTEMYREVVTGSKSGTNVSSAVVTGSLQLSFKHSVNPDFIFVVKIPAIPWTCDAMGVSVDGGPFDLKLSTDGALDLGNGAAEFILTNDVAEY